MESYEEARIESSRADRTDSLHLLQVTTSTLTPNCAASLNNKRNMKFGAEITKTQTMATEHEAETKTNTENTNAPTTNAVVASTISTIDECEATIESPLCVAELPPISSQTSNCAQNDVDDGSDVDGNGDEEDDDDSYQTDDDDDNDNSQQGHNSSGNIDASQESDESTTDSDFSDLSGLSDMSGQEWKPISTRPINWVQKQMHAGADPRELLSQMLPSSAHQIAPGVNDMLLWRILASMLAEPPRRQKLRYINTFDDVVQLVQQSKNIIVLTGAGVSVSCGIPDFRSSDGIYSRLAKDYPNLPDPQAMFDINFFSRDPRPFYKFAREIYPGQFKPSPCHRFIKLLEQKQKLLRNYTQNIDTLEQVAGIKNVIECHGSFSTASCTKCKIKCTADAIRDDIFAQRIPVCRRCQPNVKQSVDASEPVSELELRQLVENGIMKPDIVFFDEGLPEEFHTVMASDKDKCDLLIVMGSSLKVRPVALIPSSIPAHVPQILINREQLHHLEFDVELLGDSDIIINQLCHRLGEDWKKICFNDVVLQESKELLPLEDTIESEEEAQQLVDTDTQSVKSSASTDIGLRSTGGYSDSGFESSTSSGVVIGKNSTTNVSGEPGEAIEKMKSTILTLSNPLTKANSADLLPPDLLDEPAEAVDFENRGFHSFSASVGQDTATYAENGRHLSIDSSKDSGIQCDSSNSALPAHNISALLPPTTQFGDSGGTSSANSTVNDTVSASQTDGVQVALQTATTTVTTMTGNEMREMGELSTTAVRRELKKYLSAAERLIEGTYYCHESSSSYVFPGAQVSWCSDSEEEEEEDENENDFGLELDDDLDANDAPLSPLMPPSVEAEVVSEITTTSAFAICAKRASAIDNEAELLAVQNVNSENYNVSSACNPPPPKRRRKNSVEEAMGMQSTAATAVITHTTTTTSTVHTDKFDATNTVVSTETLLRQF